MRRERRYVCLVALAGTLVAASFTRAGAPPAPKDPVAELIAALQDPTTPAEQRAAARDKLATDRGLLAQGSVEKLVQLAKGTEDVSVRMQCCIAFASLRDPRDIETVRALLPLLAKWLGDKEGDLGLRYWAARAVANLRCAEALDALKHVLHDPTEKELLICTAVARDLGGWRGKDNAELKLVLPVLVGLLSHQGAEVRLAGVKGLRAAALNELEVVVPLAVLIGGVEAARLARVDDAAIPPALAQRAGPEPEEKVWRAAMTVLNEITKGTRRLSRLQMRVGAAAPKRQNAVRIWLFEWLRAKRREAEEKAPTTPG